MRTLHLRFRPTADPQQVELRYSYEVSSDYQSRRLNLEEIATLIREAETHFYTRFPGDVVRLGQRLYDWLDGSDRWLTQALQDNRRQTLVLAVDLQGRLAHLPWELLHDGESFLVQRRNPRVVPLRWQGDTPSETLPPPAPRPLHLLFMATSPEGVTVLDYEEEEGRILEATRRKPLTLTVEESGCLSELQELLDNYEAGAIDVVHLTGHGTLRDGVPCFVTESEVGDPCYSNAEDLIDSFGTRMPSLLFLSGCSTGQAQQGGNIPSLAEQLLQEGAKTVLAWGRSVLDGEATAAAAALYGGLAAGDTLADALSETYQALLKDKARDWYLLRCYGAGTVPEALVMAPRQQRVMPQRPRIRDRNLDPEGRKLVATAGEFVGRRRPIQRSLQALKYDPDYRGVLIYGMGGLGKSTLAKRLADRLADYKLLVWIDPMDSDSLLQRLSQEMGSDPILRQILQDPQDEPKWRLRRAFDYLDEMNQREDQPQTRLLLLFDDFENSLEPRQGGYVPTPEAAAVLEMLLDALGRSQTPHRLLITSRYQFDSPQLKFLYPQPLDRLDRVEVRKKCQTLSLFSDEPNQRSQRLEPELREQALRLADGYPRLLEWLNRILQDRDINRREILAQLQAERAVELREQVLATALWEQVDEPMRQMLQRGLLYELPVPEAALWAVCEGISGLGALIDRAKRLGLLEVSPDESLRVPRLLQVELPEDVEPLQAEAARALYRLWCDEAESSTEVQRLEIHRLAVAGRQGEIAAKVSRTLALKWNQQSRFRDLRQLCRQTLTVTEDYGTVHNLARSNQELGEVEQALINYRRAQELCPEEDERGQATIIHNIAVIYAQQGQVQEALSLHRQSLDIQEHIRDVRGKAVSLHQMAGIYAHQGQVQEALDLYRQSVDLKEHIGDVQGKAASLNNIAHIYAQQGQVQEALDLYQQSLNLTERIGNVQGKAATLHEIARIYARQGRVQEALDLYQQSLDLKERIGNVQGKAVSLHQMAGIYAQQGQVQESLDLYQQSLDLTEGIGNVQGKAATLHEIARIYAQQGRVQEALDLYRQSLDLAEHIGDVQRKAASLNSIAGIYAQQGQVQEALDCYQQSLDLYEHIGDVQGKAASLNSIAGIYAQQGQVKEALDCYQQSLDLYEHIGDVQGKAASLNNIANIYVQQGQVQEALDLYRQSLDLAERIGEVRVRAASSNSIAGIYAQQGQVQQAIKVYQQSLDLYEHIGDLRGKATTLHQMAVIYAQQGQVQQALDLYRQSLNLHERIGDLRGKATTLHEIAGIYARQGQVQQALDLYRQSLNLYERIGDVQGKATTLHEIAGIYVWQGQVQQALDLYRQSLDLAGRIGDVQGKAPTLTMMAQLLASQGEVETACEYMQEAIAIFDHLKSPNAVIAREILSDIINSQT